MSEDSRSQASPICVLHIPKTGGQWLKSVIAANAEHATEEVLVMKHRDTLGSTVRHYGPERRIAFTFRNPADRFVSGFNGRLRRGQPMFDNGWRTEEAVSFLWFSTANDLAEALSSHQPRVRSAAHFAMDAISHVRRNYDFYFRSLKRLERHREAIVTCVDVIDLRDQIGAVMAALGYSQFELPIEERANAAPTLADELSPRALEGLQEFWPREFRFYDEFRRIASAES